MRGEVRAKTLQKKSCGDLEWSNAQKENRGELAEKNGRERIREQTSVMGVELVRPNRLRERRAAMSERGVLRSHAVKRKRRRPHPRKGNETRGRGLHPIVARILKLTRRVQDRALGRQRATKFQQLAGLQVAARHVCGWSTHGRFPNCRPI